MFLVIIFRNRITLENMMHHMTPQFTIWGFIFYFQSSNSAMKANNWIDKQNLHTVFLSYLFFLYFCLNSYLFYTFFYNNNNNNNKLYLYSTFHDMKCSAKCFTEQKNKNMKTTFKTFKTSPVAVNNCIQVQLWSGGPKKVHARFIFCQGSMITAGKQSLWLSLRPAVSTLSLHYK